MSLSSQPPNLPEEEETNWAPAQHVAHVVPESVWARFQVSRLRLIIAMAVAPLPLLWIRYPGLHAVCFSISSISLFGAILWGRARDLPFLNLLLSFVVIEYLCSRNREPWSSDVAVLAVIVLLSVLIVRWMRRAYFGGAAGKTKCVWVLYSAVLPFAYINAEAIYLLRENASLAIPSQHALLIGSLLRVVLGLFWVSNLYWAATDRRENLDQRPWLGGRYEATMILLPFAALYAFAYVLQNAAD